MRKHNSKAMRTRVAEAEHKAATAEHKAGAAEIKATRAIQLCGIYREELSSVREELRNQLQRNSTWEAAQLNADEYGHYEDQLQLEEDEQDAGIENNNSMGTHTKFKANDDEFNKDYTN